MFDIHSISGFKRPFGLNQDPFGRFYITDMDLNTIFRLSQDFKTISWLCQFGWSDEQPIINGQFSYKPETAPSLFSGPHAIDFDKFNNFYVTTYYKPAILYFSLDGAYKGKLDSFEFQGPATAFFSKDKERLFVSEYAKSAILSFSASGEYLGGLGQMISGDFVRSKAPSGFDRPHMFKEGPDANYYCADTWNNRIQKFSKKGEFISEFRHKKLKQPVALSFTTESKMLVTSWGNSSILEIDAQSNLRVLSEFNLDKPYDAQCFGPWLLVADSHNGRLLFSRKT